MILITTPTGNIGRHVLRSLVNTNQSVRVIVRHPDKLALDLAAQIDIVQGSIDDASVLAKALNGIESLFWCIPQSHTQENVLQYYLHFTKALCTAIRETKPPRIVAVSSGGYGLAKNAGAISALHAMEELLNTTNADIKYLRCGNFMENFLWQIKPISQQGMFFYPFPSEFLMPMVCTKDIGAVAAQWLGDRDWFGQSGVGVHGAEDLTLDRVATIFSEVLNKPVRFQSIPPEAYYQSMLTNGCSSAFARSLVDLFAEVAKGIYQAEIRTRETTTPTTLKQWAKDVLAPIV
ncbi:MAG: NmrA family transcriptional regulator [Pseudanabaena sp.]|nr:MAG: NmrA family transcriptional regulator [Pseudanabaena sp.]